MARAKDTPEKAVKKHLSTGFKLVLAISGGLDSVCLLSICAQLKETKKFKLLIAHVDHKLRKNSNQDALFVKKICESYGLEFKLLKPKSNPPKNNIENWARKERYGLLSELLKRQGFDYIVTAHTANDMLETFLIKLLANKEPKNIVRIDTKRKLLRPFLDLSKNDLLTYAKSKKLKWVEDPSNQSERFTRNKIRLKLVPFLAKNFGKDVLLSLSKRSQYASTDQALIDEIIRYNSKKLLVLEFGTKEWLKEFRLIGSSFSDNFTIHLLSYIFKDKLGFNLGREAAYKVRNFLLSNSANLELPGKRKLIRKAGKIELL